ncbi:hypothetical protein HMPREF1487_09340 [Pseudomonas sp. HPB0071]|uniref:Uncharacterized protein n=1 Tax=Pseudomonas luteola TaxID=47886 RepID=A0A2X2BY71_PSELU|nr:hypothetical protein HMPREF1487_09340 [Pseudomonas sp. HPB0071]SPZ00034.1 Uncharacterised protein [Pseudomonas luteola]
MIGRDEVDDRSGVLELATWFGLRVRIVYLSISTAQLYA